MRSQHFSANRWLIFAPVAILALFAQPAKADVSGDWTYSQSQACNGSVEVVGTSITLHGPDYGGCSGQAHWVKIETTIPADVDTIDFTWTYLTNDGAWYDPPQYAVNGVFVMLTQQNNATGSMSIPVQEGDIFTFRQYSTDSCCQPGHLTISNLSLWDGLATTTTTVPDTTIPDTTTTIQETTTSWESTTTSTTTTTTTSTIAPSTTVDVTPNLTTTTLQTTTLPPDTTVPETTTVPEPETTVLETTTVPEIVDTIAPVVDTIPDTTVPNTTIPDTTVPDTLPPDTLPDAPETPDTLPIDINEEIPAELAETLLDAIDNGEPLTEEQFDTAIEALGDLNEEEAVALIEQLLDTDVTADQAEELASNPDVLAVITSDQAEEIFATIDVTELDNTQIAELTEAIQGAPLAVQKAFENTIDIFGGFDDYVPTGSNIPVGERRTLIAIAAGATLTAASSKIKGK